MKLCLSCGKTYSNRHNLSRHRKDCVSRKMYKRPRVVEYDFNRMSTPITRSRSDFIDDDDSYTSNVKKSPIKRSFINELSNNEPIVKRIKKSDVKGKGIFADIQDRIDKMKDAVKSKEIDDDDDDDDDGESENEIDDAEVDKNEKCIDKSIIIDDLSKLIEKLNKSSDNDDEEVDSEMERIEKELDQEDIEIVLPKFIDEMIDVRRKRVLEILDLLDTDGADVTILKELVNEFLNSEMKTVSEELKIELGKLKTSSKSVEIEMLLNQIEEESSRLTEILRRIHNAEVEEDDIPVVLQNLRREHLISPEIYEKLLDEDIFLHLPAILNVLRQENDKAGNGLTIYLPGSLKELKDKFRILCAEYTAGNTTTLPQILSIMDRFLSQGHITPKEHKEFCTPLER